MRDVDVKIHPFLSMVVYVITFALCGAHTQETEYVPELVQTQRLWTEEISAVARNRTPFV
jgi:hypothetical protein